jgi:hypothetical protein
MEYHGRKGKKIVKDWLEQAKNNKLEVVSVGHCQLCGAATLHGIAECIELASQVTHQIDHAKSIENMALFMCVDAHALQHAEIHGRWSNHFHLTRLKLILEDGVQWTYSHSLRLSDALNAYKADHENQFILPPAVGKRGETTVSDLASCTSESDYLAAVQRWAKEVFAAYEHAHTIASSVAVLFKR